MRPIYIAGNWKMNKNREESLSFLEDLIQFNQDFHQDKIVQILAPPFLYIDTMRNLSSGSVIHIAGQNCSEQQNGAFTGEISVDMLKDLDCHYCIIGHSERRQYFHETDELIQKKYVKLTEKGIIPIVCIGETLQEREENRTFDVIGNQLSGIFNQLKLSVTDQLLIAYEPVWAIGTGRTASPEQAQEVHHFIREWLTSHYSVEIAEMIPLLYGGSVKPDNIKELITQKDIDGGLIGGASMDVQSYKKMLTIVGDLTC